MACSTSSLPLPSVSAELPIVIFSISEGASQFAPSIIPLHAPFKVSHLVTYLTDAINQAMSICTENESVARNGIKITDVQMKGPSVVYFHFGSIADALSVYECVSTHSVHVHLCNKVKSSSSSVSSSKRVKLKDIFNISVSFDLTTSKMKYLPHYSRFNTTPTTQIVEERSIGGDEISQDIDPLLLKFGSVNSTGVGSGGGAYKRLILQPRSPDLPSSLPPMQMTASKVPDINRLTPSSSSSLSTPIKVSELTSTPLATTQAEISLPAVRLSESFTDLTSASELDLRNRFDQLGEDDTLTDFDELLEDEASYSMLPGFRSGHSKLHATDFTCPITRETINTAMRSKYGHYYERAAIMEWVSAKHQCPLTKLPLEMIDLSPSSTRYDVCLRRLQKEHLVLSTTTINTAAS